MEKVVGLNGSNWPTTDGQSPSFFFLFISKINGEDYLGERNDKFGTEDFKEKNA
jgi:hypothetical protein